MIVRSALRFQELGYSLSDILILSPMKKGPAGTLALNEQLREALNPADSSKEEWEIGKRLFNLRACHANRSSNECCCSNMKNVPNDYLLSGHFQGDQA